MAKLKAPLMSLGARGQLGKSIVFFPWKGVDAVREFVIPANPRTDAQGVQRGYLEDAVDEWHGATYEALDITAWNRYATILEKIMAGFNAMVREYILEAIKGNTWTRIFGGYSKTPSTTGFTVVVSKVSGGLVPRVYYGKSKTAMLATLNMNDVGNNTWYVDIPGLIKDTLYYFTFNVGVSGATWGRLGIYQQRTLAA